MYSKKLLAYFLVNFALLYVANSLVPELLVFGRGQIGYYQALITTAFGLMLAVMTFDLFAYDFDLKLTPNTYIILEALVNLGALYLFARTPLQNSIAVGIGAFWVAVVVGLTLSLGQYYVKKYVEHRLVKGK